VKATQFRTRTGRIVWTGADNNSNSLYDPCTKDFDGNPLGNNDDGSPKFSYRFGLAIAKLPGETMWWDCPEGKIICAQGFVDHPQAAGGSDFSWKVQDGDSTVKSAKAKMRPCDKEGYPGHWVFTINSGFSIKFVNADGSAYLLDRGAVKCGDYVQVAASVVGNTGKSPGVYINHQIVSLQGLGAAILGGPDPKTLGFGGGPQPASMLPVGTPQTNAPASNAPPPPVNPTLGSPIPGAPATPSTPPAPPPPQQQQQVPQVPVTPSQAFLGVPTAGGVPAIPAPPPPPSPPTTPAPPPGPTMTPKAGTQTYAAFIAGGWTDANLRAHGYMV
jgi:hypothetical protein